ncbi:MAG TPA: DUF1232 domain-containing protein, partial [Quisquiliibacterium sp.]|nr:DUF1232 domain-containing protein [Quisquiliibacterium sp.]
PFPFPEPAMWLLKLRRLFKSAGTEALILALAVRDPATPLAMRVAAAAALAYLISPVDLIPDIPFVGWVDDALILGMGLPYLLRRLPPEVLARATQRAEHLLGMFRFGGGRSTRAADPSSHRAAPSAPTSAPEAAPSSGPAARRPRTRVGAVASTGSAPPKATEAAKSSKATKATKAAKAAKATDATSAASATKTTGAAKGTGATRATRASPASNEAPPGQAGATTAVRAPSVRKTASPGTRRRRTSEPATG